MDEDNSVDTSTEENSTEATDDIGNADETATATSSGEQTTEDTGETVATEETKSEEAVPYSRFKEVIEERNELRRKLGSTPTTEAPTTTQGVNPQLEQVKSQLESLGFITKEQQEAELRRMNEDIRVENTLTSLAEKYNGKDGRPKFNREKVLEYAINKQIADLEAAYEQLNKKEIIDWHIKQATSGKKAIRTEASDGSGSSEATTTDEDLKQAVGKGDKNALSAYLKRRIRAAQSNK